MRDLTKNRVRQQRWRATDGGKATMKRLLAKHRAVGMALVDEAKLAGCKDCGITDVRVLEFDHVPERGPKRYGIMGVLASTHRLKEELAKCDVVCANCHAIRTRERGQGWRAL